MGGQVHEKACKLFKECENLPLFLCVFSRAAAGRAYRFKKKKQTRQGRPRDRLHFLSGNVCVCEAQARGPRVHFFSWQEGRGR